VAIAGGRCGVVVADFGSEVAEIADGLLSPTLFCCYVWDREGE